MWELDHKESWVLKNWSFWTAMLEKTLESPLDCKINPVNPKENQSWIFIGRTETPILWPPDGKNRLIGKDPDACKDWRQEEKGTTEDEMVGWHHWLNGCESEWTPGVGDGQGGLACCDSWGRKESDTTEWLNWTERICIQTMERNLKNQFKKENNHIFLMGKRLGQFPLSKEDIHMANKHMQRSSASLAIQKCKLKPQWDTTAQLVECLNLKDHVTKSMCWQGCGATRIFSSIVDGNVTETVM